MRTTTGTGWFTPALADNGQDYGWYVLAENSDQTTWRLTKVADGNISEVTFQSDGERLQSDQTVGYRLICVEAVSASAAATSADPNPFHCNTQGPTTLKDGVRSDPTATTCQTGSAGQPNDLYCQMTEASVNKNHLTTADTTKVIPAGNAVKIRSVVIWDEHGQTHLSNVATLLTNWKGPEQ